MNYEVQSGSIILLKMTGLKMKNTIQHAKINHG
jgi:hypothetical protein